MHLVRRETPDLLVLDIMMPKVDGIEVTRRLKADVLASRIPILMLTSLGAVDDKVKGLDAGADDYVVKPFTASHLDARIRAVLRRMGAPDRAEPAVVVGGLRIDPRSREVSVEGQSVDLTRKEFDLLLALARKAGQVVSKRELLAEVWQLPWGGGDRTVDVHLSWLRRKLGETAQRPRVLHTIRGVGVRLEAPPA